MCRQKEIDVRDTTGTEGAGIDLFGLMLGFPGVMEMDYNLSFLLAFDLMKPDSEILKHIPKTKGVTCKGDD